MSCGLYALVTLSLSLVVLPEVSSTTWKTPPANVSVVVGTDTTLTCEVNDRGDKIVTWIRDTAISVNNQVINQALLQRFQIVGEFNLRITNVTVSDDGEFVCTVQNFTSGSAHLNVLVAPGVPSLVVNDTQTTHSEGDVVSITCMSSGGNPAPKFLWQRIVNGIVENVSSSAILPETSVAKAQSSSQIVIALNHADDGAVYMCKVFNSLNQNSPKSTSYTFSVQYAPIITFRPAFSAFNILLYSQFDMECIVQANPPASSVIWRKGGAVIQTGAGNSLTYTFQSAQKSDSGAYSCTATNIIDTEVRSTQLDVMYAPIIDAPLSKVVTQFDDVSVRCNVDANPPVLSIQWLKVDKSTGSSSQDLNITRVQVSNAGNYSCIARNKLQLSGQVERQEETVSYTMLYVQYKPGDAFISPYSPVSTGDTLSLKCTVNDPGYPSPTFEWRHVETNTVLSTSSSTLEIPSVTLQNIGNYSCAARNSIGHGGPSFIEVDIYESPSFKEQPNAREVIFYNDTSFFFQCKVTGRPQPKVIWFKDGTPLDQYGEIYTVTTSTSTDPDERYRYLVTSQVSFQGSGRATTSHGTLLLQDIGNYTCLAVANKTSTESRTMELLILFPPQTDDDEKVAATANDTAVLSCDVEGYPIPQFQWYKGTSPLQLGGRITQEPTRIMGVYKASSVLRITNVQNVDFGDYGCIARSGQGTAAKTITLTVKNMPEAPTDLTVTSKTWESVYLKWTSGFDGGEPQTFYIRYTSLPHSSHGSNDVDVGTVEEYNVTALMPETTYDFRIFGVNRLGTGNQSESVKVTTERLFFPQIKTVPVYLVQDKTLSLDISINTTYCVRIKVSRDGGSTWSTIILKSIDCFDVNQKSYSVLEDGINKLNVSLCLRSRQDVCGAHVSAEIRQPSNPDLSATEVIAIGAVCAGILIVLLCVLIYFICRRRQNNAAKNYENAQNANRQTQPVNGANIPAKPKRGFDNPDSGQNHMNYHSHANRPNGNIPLDTSYDSQLEKRIYENEMNRRNANMNSEAYNHNKHADSLQGTPRKDPQQFIDLHPDENKEGGSFGSGMESGYSTPDPSKPKKVVEEIPKNLNSSYYSEHSHFAHDPPGHTCGLPCCNTDLYVHMKAQGHHAGCMAIPFLQRKIIEDNFTFRKHQRNLLTGRPTFRSGFHSLQPNKVTSRKPLPKFGSTRNLFYPGDSSTDPGHTLDHNFSQNQSHFLAGREITLPRNTQSLYEQYHLRDFDIGESADADISDSESSSDSDTDYYTTIPSIKEDGLTESPRLPSNLIYPWDLLKGNQEEEQGKESYNRKENNGDDSNETLNFQNNMFQNNKFKMNRKNSIRNESGKIGVKRHTLGRTTNIVTNLTVEVDIHMPNKDTKLKDEDYGIIGRCSPEKIKRDITKETRSNISEKDIQLHLDMKSAKEGNLGKENTKPPLPKRPKQITNHTRSKDSCAENVKEYAALESSRSKSYETSQTIPQELLLNGKNTEVNNLLVSGDDSVESPRSKSHDTNQGIPQDMLLNGKESFSTSGDGSMSNEKCDPYLKINMSLKENDHNYDQVTFEGTKSANRSATGSGNPANAKMEYQCMEGTSDGGATNIDSVTDKSQPNSDTLLYSDTIPIIQNQIEFKDRDRRLSIINEGFENEDDIKSNPPTISNNPNFLDETPITLIL